MITSAVVSSFMKWVLPVWYPEVAKLTTDHYPLGLLITTFFCMAVWVPVTLFTKPTKMENLVDFYRRVRPVGFWGPVKEQIGDDFEAEHVTRYDVITWISAVASIFGFVFGFGNLLMGKYVMGIVLMAVFAAGLMVMLKAVAHNEWWNRDIDAIQAAEDLRAEGSG